MVVTHHEMQQCANNSREKENRTLVNRDVKNCRFRHCKICFANVLWSRKGIQWVCLTSRTNASCFCFILKSFHRENHCNAFIKKQQQMRPNGAFHKHVLARFASVWLVDVSLTYDTLKSTIVVTGVAVNTQRIATQSSTKSVSETFPFLYILSQ